MLYELAANGAVKQSFPDSTPAVYSGLRWDRRGRLTSVKIKEAYQQKV